MRAVLYAQREGAKRMSRMMLIYYCQGVTRNMLAYVQAARLVAPGRSGLDTGRPESVVTRYGDNGVSDGS